MELKDVILQTLGMMGFTFLVGMAVAYLIKFLVYIFLFFKVETITHTLANYKSKIAHENWRRASIRRMLYSQEQNSDVEFLRYIYENKNKHNAKEVVDDLYNLFQFYKGTNSDREENKENEENNN
jgi:hypothetical protein